MSQARQGRALVVSSDRAPQCLCFPPTRPGLCSVAALVHMVSAECRASCEVQCCPYATDIDVILTLAQGDYLATADGDTTGRALTGLVHI